MELKEQPLKIAILTEYYNSNNYGGILQAYALTKVLNKKFGSTEQLCYYKTSVASRNLKGTQKKSIKTNSVGSIKVFFRQTARRWLHKLCSLTFAYEELTRIKGRENLIRQFADRIPHSSEVFNDDNIANCVDHYDVFIVGSDQVWRNFEDRAYWLKFVPHSKIKLSYAASIARESLGKEEKNLFREALCDFNAVSVREENAVFLLKDCCRTKPQWVLDPTLLLDRPEWDIVCTERRIQGNYLFCYFLGMSKKHRLIAAQYAKKKNLRLIIMPYLRGVFETCDAFIGNSDDRLFNVSPEDFISLIKNAKCIITDSFHAAVFSAIYNKEFFVFERPEKVSMGSRIDSLMKIFRTEKRYCDTMEKQSVEYMESCLPIDYLEKNEKYETLKSASFEFLEKNLNLIK